VGDVIMRIGLCLFGPLYLTLEPNLKREIFVYFGIYGLKTTNYIINPLGQGWAIKLARGPL